MSSKSILYFDKMNILQFEKDIRVEACDELQSRIENAFMEYKSSDMTKTMEFENDLIKSFAVWGSMIGYFSMDDLVKISQQMFVYINNLDQLVNELKEKQPIDDRGRAEGRQYVDVVIDFQKIEDDVRNIVENTVKNSDDQYYTSSDRAFNIAKDQTNQKFNQMHHERESIGASYHRWVCEHDNKTRGSHLNAGGQVKPIGEPFDVGGFQMMYPMDYSFGAPAKEICGCRCSEEIF